MVHVGVDAALVGGLHRMVGYFTLPFGSGCWAAPTDQFGSIAVSSAHKLLCRSDRFTKVYVDFFFRQPLFTVFEAHELLCFLGVYTNISPCKSPASFLNLEYWNCENSDSALPTRCWGQTMQECLPIVTRATIASWVLARVARAFFHAVDLNLTHCFF